MIPWWSILVTVIVCEGIGAWSNWFWDRKKQKGQEKEYKYIK